jgi:hypothetical protein
LDDPLIFEKNMTFAIETQQGKKEGRRSAFGGDGGGDGYGYEVMTRWPSKRSPWSSIVGEIRVKGGKA